jgi:hypothetical protein
LSAPISQQTFYGEHLTANIASNAREQLPVELLPSRAVPRYLKTPQ